MLPFIWRSYFMLLSSPVNLWCRYIISLALTSQGCVHKYVNNYGSILGTLLLLLLLLRRSWMFVACLRFWSGDRTILHRSQWHWRPFPEPLRMEYGYKYLNNAIMQLLLERICSLIKDIMLCKSWTGLILPISLHVGILFVSRGEYAVAGISNRSRLLLLQEQRDCQSRRRWHLHWY